MEVSKAKHEQTQLSDLSDNALLEKAQSGDAGAFARFVARHRQTIHNTAFGVLGNGDDAHDAAQEALLYALAHLSVLQAAQNPSAYLKATTVSIARDFRRRRATRQLPGLPQPFEMPVPDSTQDAPDRIAVRQALADLHPALRQTLNLIYEHGYSHSEVAELTDVPVATVRSRLQRARRSLHNQLAPLFPERMPRLRMSSDLNKQRPLPAHYLALLESALPGSHVLSVAWEPEPWMPFIARARLSLPSGDETSVDFRWDILNTSTPDPDRAFPGMRTMRLHAALARLGLPVPRFLSAPVPDDTGKPGATVTLAQTPPGENLLLWSLDGNVPHRIYAATTLGIAAIQQLHGLTDGLLADPIGDELPRRPLSLDLQEIMDKGGPWLSDPLFAQAVEHAGNAIAGISVPLVYTNDLYFPNFLRVQDGQVTEFVYPWGHLGDPLLGLAKFWTYDCYPFVRTGFVERYLYEHGFTRRDLAPRLAVRTLWTLQREVTPERTDENAAYHDALTSLLRHALAEL